MSKTEQRTPYATALLWAQDAATVVRLYSPEVWIAGSIRRQRPDVGDTAIICAGVTGATAPATTFARRTVLRAALRLGMTTRFCFFGGTIVRGLRGTTDFLFFDLR